MKPLLASALLCLLSISASANDSIATIGAGGLVLANSPDIVMEKEELFLSTENVKVDYLFRNASATDRTHIVAFPVPLIEPGLYVERDMPIADRESDNFLNFTVTADGKPITPKLELRALSGVIDITDRLVAMGIPLNPLKAETERAMSKLSAAQKQELDILGAKTELDGNAAPYWTLKAAYYWEQTFPTGKTIAVSHTYHPGTGAWFYYPEMAVDEQIIERFCLDRTGIDALKRSGTRNGLPWELAKEIEYVLTTGANWAGPIGDFRLVVDKGQPDALVSFCEEGVTKISPTQFEVRRQDFTPSRDLRILVVTPRAKEQ